ncbi:MAG: matrixin family metalloprotease [Verrucomicrobiota bacterium]
MYRFVSGTMTETDTVFNLALTYDSYRGPLQFGSNGVAIVDIRRVFLHELGHGLGLGHPDSSGQQVDAIMNALVSDRAVLAADDIAGVQSLYGAPAAPPPPTTSGSRLANISTRLRVGVGDSVLIGGFIISGTVAKQVIFRATGPSLAGAGIAGALADPTLEVRDSTGALIASNDNWQTSAQASQIASSGLAPTNSLESAIIATLAPGSYTAIVQGRNSSTGVGLVEGYEIGTEAAKLANIATRGRVGTGDDVLIGGIIISGSTSKSVLIRAIGPSLANYINGALLDPVLELRNSSGSVVATSDNWNTSSQYSQIVASGLAPADSRESAIAATLSPGSYTAIVNGAANTTGVALVEVYDLDP